MNQLRALALCALSPVYACATAETNLAANNDALSFEEFEAATYHEDFEHGVYIVNGDTPVLDAKALYEFWQINVANQGALIVDNNGGTDSKWNDVQKLNLTYCVSNNFGANKARVLAAFKAATDQGWETRANVNFVYVAAEDNNCNANNPNVVFDVRQVSNQPYLARAFFPNSPRAAREVLIDTSSFGNTGWAIENIIGHELGHALGFRHEHTRPESGACFEDNNWRPLTPYDAASIMHYPQCNGSSQDLNWTARDAEGAAALYGAPGSTPIDPGTPATSKRETQSGTLAVGTRANFGPYSVKAGSLFTVKMTGTGDPDLYVRFGSAPTLSRFSCRPYLDGATEACSLSVPAGQSTAYVMVHAYTAASFALDISWTAP